MLARDRRPFQTADGYVCALIYNDKQWRAFVALIGKPELMQSDKFRDQEARSRNYDDAYALVDAEMRKRSTEQWIEALEAADIPVQRMNSLADIIADPHLAAIGYLREIDHPSEGRIRSMAVPSEWSETVPEYRLHAPRHGQHTRELLSEAGLDESAIEALLASGAAKAAD